jgi:hypothetical protein
VPGVVGSEINIGQPVVVDIPYGNTTAIVIIDITQNAQVFSFFQVIGEIDMCPGSGYAGEQFIGTMAGK